MSLLIIPVLLVGPGLIIASFFAKRMTVRVLTTIGGVVMIAFLAYLFSSVLLAYEREHRSVENGYHRQIIAALDEMLAKGRTDGSRSGSGLE
jgi:hypothetical protein